jgi:hypothetical protein
MKKEATLQQCSTTARTMDLFMVARLAPEWPLFLHCHSFELASIEEGAPLHRHFRLFLASTTFFFASMLDLLDKPP